MLSRLGSVRLRAESDDQEEDVAPGEVVGMNDKRPQDGEEADGMPELDRVAPHPTVDVLAARDEDEIQVLVWHRVCDQYRQGEGEVRIEIDGLDGWESAGITHYRVCEGRSNARRGFRWMPTPSCSAPDRTSGVECDTDGMLPDSLEYQIQAAIDEGRRPKAVYTIPTFQNPLGFVASLPRRAEVTEITARYGVPVWEDDCYVDLNFDHPDLPPAIRSLDDSGRTIYVASFSKNIAPGMRLGYVTAAPALMDRIAAIKGTGGVSQFAAMAVHRFAQTGLDAHIERARARLRAKRDALLAALEAHLGDRARWTQPAGGLFLFVQMLDGSDTVAAAERAAARGVLFAPGTHAAADGVSGRDRMRLCYGWNRPEEMAAAIAELAAALQPELAAVSR